MEHYPELLKSISAVNTENAKNEIRLCNEETTRYGLMLNEEQIADLVECRKEALAGSGRVEFGGGILPKLIRAFCDSPYMEKDSYADTLAQLQEAFYYYKTESEDLYKDDELIEFMVSVYNGRAQGSAEYLIGTGLEELARYARADYDPRDAGTAGDLF